MNLRGRAKRLSTGTYLYALIVISAAFWARLVLDQLKTLLPPEEIRAGVLVLLVLPAASILPRVLTPLTPARATVAGMLLLACGGICMLLPIAEERIHIVEYAILGALIFSDLKKIDSRAAFSSAFVIAASIGLGDELIQWCLPSRVGDPRDVVVNAAGGFIGIALASIDGRWKVTDAPGGNAPKA